VSENFDFRGLVDVHVHWHSPNEMSPDILKMIMNEFPILNSMKDNPNDPSPLLELLDKEKVDKAFIINYMSPKVMGYSFATNEWVSKFCSNSEERLIPVGGVDPLSFERSGDKIRSYLENELLKIIKVHGPHQLVAPNAYVKNLESQANLYDTCVEFGVPILIHTGTSIFPKARSKFGHPLLLEDMLIDYPELKVIMAHGGRPFWTQEAEYLMIKFPKLMMDLSGIPPKLINTYYPKFVRYADRCIFGSDFPSPGVPGILKNAISLNSVISDIGIKEDVKRKIFRENALNLIK
jgi:uncharacterized protein